MGNHMSLRPSDATGKIVYWDGSVQEFDQPLTAAELMLEHPQQVVVEFHSAVNQKRPTPLPADKKLEKSKVYAMLPVKRGKPVKLSGEESRRILLIVNNSALHSKYLLCSSRFLARVARLCQNTAVGVAEAGVVQRNEGMEKREERCVFSELLPETLDGRPEYLGRQLSETGWKPSLDPIEEKKTERKLSNRFFFKSF